MEPDPVYYSHRGARVVVRLPSRFAVSEKGILANYRRARATWFLARPALWQRFLHFPKHSGDTRLRDTRDGWSDSNRGIRLLPYRLHAGAAELYLV